MALSLSRTLQLSGLLCLCLLLVLTAPPADAGRNLKGNGFPAGFHYNLNILGKKLNFSCPDEVSYRCVMDTEDRDGDTITDEPLDCTNLAAGETCIEALQCVADSQNVVFIPRFTEEYGGDTSISLASGSTKGGKNKTASSDDLDGDGLPDLQVTDWCSEAFDSTPATVAVPPYSGGYAVFARVTGKPCSYKDENGNCQTSITLSNDLAFINDDQGNDLLMLGFVTGSGQWADLTLNREEDGTKTTGPGGKGVRKATNISDAFTFSGTLCYISPGDQSYFCENANQGGTPVDTDMDGTPDYWLPTGGWFSDDPDDNGDGAATTAVGDNGEDDWADLDATDTDGNTIPDMIEMTTSGGCDVNAYCYNNDGSSYQPIADLAELAACETRIADDIASGAVPDIAYFEQWSDPDKLVIDAPAVATCRTYTDAWVFSIADFVSLLWGIDNQGSYNVQVRFYPYDQVCDQIGDGSCPGL